MHLKFRNVNDAFTTLVYKIYKGEIQTVKEDSRAGTVLRIPEPVIVTYTHPTERVLFNRARDANCFFHLYESLWMLAGRNDVAPLSYYNSKIAEIASDDGTVFNGAYGYRWRGGSYQNTGFRQSRDQIRVLIKHLKEKPESRRAVLQMWTVEDDLLKIDTSRDVCCNTCVYFHIEDGKLNITVSNRSNDLVWGMLGANVVHFSILQEYMAACIGVKVGVYNQFTNNLHVYVDNWKPEEWLSGYRDQPEWEDPYLILASAKSYPLVTDPKTFGIECRVLVERFSGGQPFVTYQSWGEPFFNHVAQSMFRSYSLHKERKYDLALDILENMPECDWKLVAIDWIVSRYEAWRTRKQEESVQ